VGRRHEGGGYNVVARHRDPLNACTLARN